MEQRSYPNDLKWILSLQGIDSIDQGYGIVRGMDRDLIFPYFSLVKPG